MNPAIEQLQARVTGAYAQLQPRERMIVLIGAAVLAALIAYLGVWEPLVKAHHHNAEALEASRALAIRIEAAASLAKGQSSGGADRSAALLSVVDQSSRNGTLGKAPTRLQPEGSGEREVKVWFEDVQFDNALRWLTELQTRYAIQVSSAEIDQGSAPGLVNARFTLSR